jgi:hypothetical protein
VKLANRGRPKKVDNTHRNMRAKVTIRRNVLESVGADRAVVFDAFAGSGVMWSEVWQEAADYVGCDERWFQDSRCCYVADNRRVLRCADLARFNLFDLDAYGSPWEQAYILACRRPLAPGERIGLVITDGSWTKTRMQEFATGFLQVTGMVPNDVMKYAQARYGMRTEMLSLAVRGIAHRMRGTIVKEWRAAGMTGALMQYLGLVIESNRATRPEAPAAVE